MRTGSSPQRRSTKVRIKYIVNTHGHVDHTGANVDVKRKTNAEIIIHEDDAMMLTDTPAAMLRMFGAKASPPADRTVRDGDLITAGAVQLKVIHTPGHSPGSMVLYTPGYAFTRRYPLRRSGGENRSSRRFR